MTNLVFLTEDKLSRSKWQLPIDNSRNDKDRGGIHWFSRIKRISTRMNRHPTVDNLLIIQVENKKAVMLCSTAMHFYQQYKLRTERQ